MDALLEVLLSCPSSADGVEAYLNNIRSKSDIIMGAATHVDGSTTALMSVLVDIPVSNCSAGFVLLLALQSEALNETGYITFLSLSRNFFFNAQSTHIPFIHAEVTKVARAVTKIACVLNKSRSILPMLLQAIQLLSPSPTCLTIAHPLYLQACMKGQMYDVAVEFIKTSNILEVNLKQAPILSVDLLNYFYYAGVCYIAVEDYPSALASLLQCMCTPAHSLSAVVVAAAKKARLVAMIHYGRDFTTSASIPGVVQKYLKKPMIAYDSIASAFLKTNPNNLETVLLAEHEVLTKDNNYELAQSLRPAWTKHCLLRISKTFISLSLNEIMKRSYLTDIHSTEQYLLKLVQNNELLIKINPEDGIVTFDSEFNSKNHSFFLNNMDNTTTDSRKQADLAEQLESNIQVSMELSQRLREMQKNTVTSYKYLMKSSSSGSSSGDGALGSGIPLSIVGRGGRGMGGMDVEGMGAGYGYGGML